MSKFSTILSIIEGQGGGFLLFASTILIVAQIVMRALFGFAISGIYELATFCVIWSAMLTVGQGIRNNVHVRVDILMRIVPLNVARVMEFAICATLLWIGLWLVYSGVLLVQESMTFGDTTLGTIRISIWIPQLIMPISGTLIMFHTIERIIGLWRGTSQLFDDDEITPST